jgi:hypothetical protein
MNFKQWLIIKDDDKRTFEVVSQTLSDNAFFNKVIAMQRDGMNVTSVIIPVSNTNASKDHITFTGYSKEAGLYDRLVKQHQQLIQQQWGGWDAD